MSLSELVYGIAILIISAILAYNRLREAKITKRYQMRPNPERCAVMEERMTKVEKRMDEMAEEIEILRRDMRMMSGKLQDCLTDIKVKLAKVEERTNRGGRQ